MVTAAMTRQSYLYCITPANVELSYLPGIHGVGYGSVQGVVRSTMAPWLMKDATPSQQELEVLAYDHHTVAQQLLTRCTPIPMRIGTLFVHDDEVRSFLRRAEPVVMQTLNMFQGRREWGLKLEVDRAAIAQHLVQENIELCTLERRITTAAPGTRYLLEKHREKLLAEACSKWIADATDRLVKSFGDCVERWVTLRAVRGEAWNAAALVRNEREREFADEAAQCNGLLAGRALLIITGPWAPYSFVPSVEVRAL